MCTCKNLNKKCCCESPSNSTVFCNAQALGDVTTTGMGLSVFSTIINSTYTVPVGSSDALYDIWFNCNVKIETDKKIELYFGLNGVEIPFSKVKTELLLGNVNETLETSVSMLKCSLSLKAGDVVSLYGLYTDVNSLLYNANMLIKKN